MDCIIDNGEQGKDMEQDSIVSLPMGIKFCTNNLNAILQLEEAVPQVTEKYKVAWSVARGHFGSVLLAAEKHMNRPLYAVKLIHFKKKQTVENEVKYLKELKGSKNIVQYIDHFFNASHAAIVTKYFHAESFSSQYKNFSAAEVQKYMKNLLKCIREVHAHHITHGDIKPDNFLFNIQKNKYLLVDLGMAMPFGLPCVDRGTKGYIAPECILQYKESSSALDVFSAGVIFIILLSGVRPFFVRQSLAALSEFSSIFGNKNVVRVAHFLGKRHYAESALHGMTVKKPLNLMKLCRLYRNYDRYYEEVKDRNPCFNCGQMLTFCICDNEMDESNRLFIAPDVFPESAYNLLERMLKLNPARRISVQEALNHQFFQESLNSSMPFFDPKARKFSKGIIIALNGE